MRNACIKNQEGEFLQKSHLAFLRNGRNARIENARTCGSFLTKQSFMNIAMHYENTSI